MARETKAQREAREEAEAQMAWGKFKAEYPVRFTKTLFEFMSIFEGKVTTTDYQTYTFETEWENRYSLPVVLPEERDFNMLYNLEYVENDVTRYYEAQAEENRKDQVRRSALSKLSAEERDLLGV